MENKKPAGLLVSVYRDESIGDCTNGGVSSRVNQVILVGEGIPPIFEVREGLPALYLVKGRGGREWIATPDGQYNMFGGNFIFSSDSRFIAISRQPIHVHDRVE